METRPAPYSHSDHGQMPHAVAIRGGGGQNHNRLVFMKTQLILLYLMYSWLTTPVYRIIVLHN